MPRFASFARVGMVATFAVVLAGACGGQSFTNNGGGDAGSGSGSTGGSGQGGALLCACAEVSPCGDRGAGAGSRARTAGRWPQPCPAAGVQGDAAVGGTTSWSDKLTMRSTSSSKCR